MLFASIDTACWNEIGGMGMNSEGKYFWALVGRCRLTASIPVLKAPVVSSLNYKVLSIFAYKFNLRRHAMGYRLRKSGRGGAVRGRGRGGGGGGGGEGGEWGGGGGGGGFQGRGGQSDYGGGDYGGGGR